MLIQKIESLAEEVLSSVNIKSAPVPIEEIVSSYKIQIGKAPSEDFSGLLLRRPGVSLIGVNSDEASVRQRFTIAHELGHFLLHAGEKAFIDYRKEDSGVSHVEYRDNKKEQTNHLKERQANIFAAAILMPRALITKDLKTLPKGLYPDQKTEILAEKYEVSKEAMRIRLSDLLLLNN